MLMKWAYVMFMKKIFKKNPVDYKQPQEYYCANFECLNEIARLSDLFYLLDDSGVEYSNMYCIDCIVERKIK